MGPRGDRRPRKGRPIACGSEAIEDIVDYEVLQSSPFSSGVRN